MKKNQTRITGIDSQILALYARGLTTREITAPFKEMYNADVSPALISKVTDAVIELVVEWQNRPQDTVYPIFYLDCIVLNVLELKYRGLNDIFIACVDGLRGSPDAINAAYPEAQLQLCIDHMA